jgi:hypothetical protein
MRKNLSVVGELETSEPFAFPTLTQDRAEQLADALMVATGGDDRILFLVAEIALGIEPTHAPNDNVDRADAAATFLRRVFVNVRAFDDYCEGLKARLADPKSHAQLYRDLDAAYAARHGGR